MTRQAGRPELKPSDDTVHFAYAQLCQVTNRFACLVKAPHLAGGYCLAELPLAGRAGFFVRQASEQYFTSAQFLAQLLRQVISRPQVTQILLGKPALFPLKPDRGGMACEVLVERIAVVMRVGAVVTTAQFHRHVLVGVGDAFYTQKRRSVLYF